MCSIVKQSPRAWVLEPAKYAGYGQCFRMKHPGEVSGQRLDGYANPSCFIFRHSVVRETLRIRAASFRLKSVLIRTR